MKRKYILIDGKKSLISSIINVLLFSIVSVLFNSLNIEINILLVILIPIINGIMVVNILKKCHSYILGLILTIVLSVLVFFIIFFLIDLIHPLKNILLKITKGKTFNDFLENIILSIIYVFSLFITLVFGLLLNYTSRLR